jgi:hypothetical protein
MEPQEFFKSRRDRRTARADSDLEWVHPDSALEFPYLFHFISLKRVNERTRDLGKVILFCEDGRLKTAVSDVDTGEVLFLTLESLEAALYAIDKAISSSDSEWRESRRIVRR